MIIKMRFGYFFIPVFLIFFFSCLCNLYAQQELNPVEKYGRLSFKEGRLRDARDNIIVLRGMSLFWSQWQPQFYNEDTVKKLRDFWKVNVACWNHDEEFRELKNTFFLILCEQINFYFGNYHLY